MQAYSLSSESPNLFSVVNPDEKKATKKKKVISNVGNSQVVDFKPAETNEDGIPKKKKNKEKKEKVKTVDPEKARIKREKAERKRQERRRECEIEMIQLTARRDMLEKQLNNLDIGKPKDSKVIAAINVELLHIREELAQLSKESGIELTSVDSGTRFGRFMAKVKRFGSRMVKRAKKFYKRNKELIYGMASIIIPFIASFAMKVIFHI